MSSTDYEIDMSITPSMCQPCPVLTISSTQEACGIMDLWDHNLLCGLCNASNTEVKQTPHN